MFVATASLIDWEWPKEGLGVLGRRSARRLLTPRVSVRDVEHGGLRSPVGMNLLGRSCTHEPPHPSACDGRGRRLTRRVPATRGHAALPEPIGIERHHLNQVVAGMTRAVEARGAQVALVPTDDVVAIFRDDCSVRRAARGALSTTRDSLRAIDATNRRLAGTLSQTLRASGHAGPVVVARVDDEQRGHRPTAIDEAVFVADSLEAASKEYAVDAMISQAALEAACVPPPGAARLVPYKHGETSVLAPALADALDQQLDLRGRSTTDEEAQAAGRSRHSEKASSSAPGSKRATGCHAPAFARAAEKPEKARATACVASR